MITNKIEALKIGLKTLKDPKEEYNHGHPASCNCGHIIKGLTGMKDNEVVDSLANDGLDIGYYSAIVKSENLICDTSGLPVNDVIKAMFIAGFSDVDITELESLSNIDILKRAGIPANLYNNYNGDMILDGCGLRENVIAYITAWISILEEKEPKEEVKTVYVTVEIDTKVKELTQELILN